MSVVYIFDWYAYPNRYKCVLLKADGVELGMGMELTECAWLVPNSYDIEK